MMSTVVLVRKSWAQLFLGSIARRIMSPGDMILEKDCDEEGGGVE